jgi:uncharacterized membrane protein
MEKFNIFIFARALHIAAVVFWIGGVAFVTTVLIPALKKTADGNDRLVLFEQLEGKFGLQAKVTTLLSGLSGFYLLYYLQAWDRFLQLQYWWMHLMLFVWLAFTAVLFVLEPLFLHSWFRRQATKDSDRAFAWLHRMHIVLLSLSILALVGAVAGSHGYRF